MTTKTHSSHLHKLLIVFTTLTIFAGLSAATTVSKNTDVSGDMGPGEEVQIYELQFDASQDSIITDEGITAATQVNSFDTSTEYVSPGASSYADGMPIVDESSTTDTLESSSEIITDGTNGILTGLSSSDVEYHEENGNGEYDSDGSGNYGEAIYNTGADGTISTGTDTRVTPVTVNSGSDSDVTTLDLNLNTDAVISSGAPDTGKALTDFSSATVNEIDGSGGVGTIESGDTIILDLGGNSQYDQGTDIVLIGSEPSIGTNYDTSDLTGNWETGQYNSNGAVIFDRGSDDSSTTPDIIIESGSVTLGTAGTYDSTSGTVRFWDADSSSGYNSGTDSVYVDIGSDDVDGGSDGDARLTGFTKTFSADTTVNSGDVDAGVSVSSFNTGTHYLDDDNSGVYENGEAIIKNGGTAGNLESSDTVEVSGTLSLSASDFASDEKHDGASSYEDGDAIITDGDGDGYYGDQLTELDVLNADNSFSSSSATITVYSDSGLSTSVGSTTGFGTISSLSASATDGTQTFYIAVDVPTDVAADQDDNTIAADVENADTVSGSTLDANANSNSQIVNVPHITETVTKDSDNSGGIDQVTIQFSEAVDISSTSGIDNLQLSNTNIDIANNDYSGQARSSSVTVDLSSETSDTAGTTSTSYTNGGALTSDSGSYQITEAMTQLTETDGAAPIVNSAAYRDSDEDGTVDKVDVDFSEAVDYTPNTVSDDWNLAVNDLTGLSLDSKNSESSETVILDATATDITGVGSSTEPAIDISDTSTVTDTSANNAETSSQVSLADEAAPVIDSGSTADYNTDGQVDAVNVTLTEPIDDSASTFDSGTFSTGDGDASVDGSSTGESSDDDSVEASINGAPSGDTAFTLSDLTLSIGVISDGSNSIASSYPLSTVSDGAAPLADSVVTGDSDDNGKIDQVTVGYTESVESVVTGDYSLDSYSLGSEESSSGSSIVMNVQESGDYDTGATPALSYTGSGTTDGNGNELVEVSASTADGADPVVADVDFSKDTVLDADRDQTVNVTYSETMNTGTTPTVSFNSVTSTGPSDTAWYDNMSTSDTFEAVYTLDDGQDVAGVDADVSGGEDDSSNTQVSSTSTSTFDVDTQEPVFDSQSATALAEGDIEVDWTLSTSDGDSFEIFRKNDTAEGGSYSLLSDSPSQPYPDSDTEHGVNYTYKVEATDDDGNSINSSEVEATSDSEGPSFSYTGPEGFQTTDSPSITVDVSDEFHDVDESTISVTVDSVDTEGVEIDSVGTDNGSVKFESGTLTVDLSADLGDEINLAEGDVDVSVSADDSLGNSNSTTEESAFTVDTETPNVEDVEISDNDDGDGVVAEDDEVLVEVNVSDATSGVDTVTTNYDEFVSGSDSVELSSSEGSSDYTGTFTVGSPGDDGDKSVTVDATDVAGNELTGDTSAGTLQVDTTGPSISSANTNDLNKDGEIDQINVTLDEAIVDSDSTLNASTFDLDSGTVDSVSTGDSSDDDNLELSVSEISDTSTTPRVTLATELSYVELNDSAGNTQTSNSSVTATDSADPVLMYAEIDYQDSTDSNTRVNLEFSETVSDDGTDSDAAWINGEAFDLVEASTQEVSYGSALQTGDSPPVNLSEEVTDASGNVAVNLSGEDVEVDTFREQLDEGWNFVSFPVADHTTYEIDNVMDSSNVEVVWKYVDGEWKSSNTDFDTVEGGYGYLVKAEQAFTIDPNVNNIRETVDEVQEPTQSVDLSNGWNLVGQFQEFDQTADTSEAFGSLNSGDLGAVEAQASAGDLGLNRITDMDGSNAGTMATGEAYWMWAKDSTSYTWY